MQAEEVLSRLNSIDFLALAASISIDSISQIDCVSPRNLRKTSDGALLIELFISGPSSDPDLLSENKQAGKPIANWLRCAVPPSALPIQPVDPTSLPGAESRSLLVSGGLKAQFQGIAIKPKHFGFISTINKDFEDVVLCATCVRDQFLLMGTSSGLIPFPIFYI